MIRALQVWLSLAVLGAGPGRLLMERTATVVLMVWAGGGSCLASRLPFSAAWTVRNESQMERNTVFLWT